MDFTIRTLIIFFAHVPIVKDSNKNCGHWNERTSILIDFIVRYLKSQLFCSRSHH